MNLKTLNACIFLIAVLVLVPTIQIALAQSASTMWISSGIYPQADYTIWKEGSYYYAKNAYGQQPSWSGVTNESAIIQNALNSLTYGRTWKEKVVVKGSISPSSTINIPSYCVLEIDKITYSVSHPNPMLQVTNGKNIELRVGMIYASGISLNTSRAVIKMDGGSGVDILENILIENIVFQGIPYTGIKIRGYGSNIEVRNIIGYNHFLELVSIYETSLSYHFQNVKVEGLYSYVASYSGTPHDIVDLGSVFKGSCRDIYHEGPTYHLVVFARAIEGVSFENIHHIGTNDGAISVYDGLDCDIRGISGKDTAWGGVILHAENRNVERITISDVFVQNSTSGQANVLYCDSTYNITDVILENIQVDGAFWQGLIFDYAGGASGRAMRCIVSNPIIKNAGQDGNLSDSLRVGILVDDGTYITIYGGQLYDDQETKTQKYGLVESNNADYNVFYGINARDNDIAGIMTVGSNTKVNHCWNGTSWIS